MRALFRTIQGACGFCWWVNGAVVIKPAAIYGSYEEVILEPLQAFQLFTVFSIGLLNWQPPQYTKFHISWDRCGMC